MKNNIKKGISLVGVLLIVVIMSILTGIISISIYSTIDNTYKREFIAECKLVKSATYDYIKRNSGIIDFTETELDLSTIKSKYLTQFEGENIVDNKIEVYVIDLEKIGLANATYGMAETEDDVYLLSKDQKIVYYKKGFDDNGTIYYKAIED